MRVTEKTTKLNHKKVTARLPPNYIHGMDASHLMLTVNRCNDMGIQSFALVHDSFDTYEGKTTRAKRGYL
jgi:DNA-directed RNA polymerase, mitochondrial